jgi:hypothetical protein
VPYADPLPHEGVEQGNGRSGLHGRRPFPADNHAGISPPGRRGCAPLAGAVEARSSGR